MQHSSGGSNITMHLFSAGNISYCLLREVSHESSGEYFCLGMGALRISMGCDLLTDINWLPKVHIQNIKCIHGWLDTCYLWGSLGSGHLQTGTSFCLRVVIGNKTRLFFNGANVPLMSTVLVRKILLRNSSLERYQWKSTTRWKISRVQYPSWTEAI